MRPALRSRTAVFAYLGIFIPSITTLPCYAYLFYGLPDQIASSNWPIVQADIVRDLSVSSGIGYRYTIDDGPHPSDRSGSTLTFLGGLPDADLPRPATTHPVAYDPTNPSRGVLQPGLQPRHAGLLLMSATAYAAISMMIVLTASICLHRTQRFGVSMLVLDERDDGVTLRRPRVRHSCRAS